MELSQLNINVAVEELIAAAAPSSSKGRTSGFGPENVGSTPAEGTNEPVYPDTHKAGMRVPKGGSSCASCEYLAENKTDCKNKYYQDWHGSEIIPAPPDQYCCDWYEHGKDLQAYGTTEGVTKAWDTRGRGQRDYREHDVHVGIFDRPEEEGNGAMAITRFFNHEPPAKETREALLREFSKASKIGESEIDVKDIIPMQDTLEKSRIEKLQQADEETFRSKHAPAVFFKDGNYYLIDGHHRVGMDIMDGKDKIKARVFKSSGVVRAEADAEVQAIFAEKYLQAGGPGSGCNPEAGKCGRPAGDNEDPDAEREKGESLMNALQDWQEGSHYIRLAAQDVLTNRDTNEGVQNLKYNVDAVKDAKALLDEIRNGTTMTQAIYRGVSVMDKTSPYLALKEGDKFQLPLQSFTKNVGVAHGFSMGKTQGDAHVIFQVDPGAKVLDLSKAMGENVYHEVEVITNGKFKVTGVEDAMSYGPEPFHVVHVQHMGVF